MHPGLRRTRREPADRRNMGFTLRSVKKLASTTCYVKKWFYLKIAPSHFQRCLFWGPFQGPIGALQSSLLAFAEFDFGSCRVQCWHSAAFHSGGQTRRVTKWLFLNSNALSKISFAPLGAFEIRMLFRKSCLRFWEPRPSEQGGFRHRSLYVLISRLLPPASSLFLILIRSGRQPSGTHP